MKTWDSQPNFQVRQKSPSAAYQEIRVMNPSRGLNNLVADILANDKEATDGTENIEYVEGGAAQKRMGYNTVVGSLGGIPQGIGQYISESANYPVFSVGGVLKKYQSGTVTNLNTTPTMDSTAQVNITSFLEKTYFWDGINSGIVWDGSTLSRPGTLPKAKYSVIYKGRHIIFGVPGQPYRIYFSNSTEPSRVTWDSTVTTPAIGAGLPDLRNATGVPGATVFTGDRTPNAIDIDKQNGQKVMGIGFFQDSMIVFKEHSIYEFTFDTSGNPIVQRISNVYGTIAHNSIVAVENDLYFLTDKGVFVLGNEPNYYAAIRTNELSSRVRNLLQRATASQLEKTQGVYWDDRYFLSMPLDASTVNNAVIVYDRRFYAWMLWTNIPAGGFLVFQDKDVDNRVHFYFSSNTDATIKEFVKGLFSDDGDAIDAVFVTRAFDGKQLDREKYWYTVRPILRNATGTIKLTLFGDDVTYERTIPLSSDFNGGIGNDEYGALMFGTSGTQAYSDDQLGISASSGVVVNVRNSNSVYDISANIDSRTLKMRFENDGVGENFVLLGWVILFQVKDTDRFDGNFTIR